MVVRKLTSFAVLASMVVFGGNVWACGGCFSPPGVQSNQQILQNAERVFFHYDPGTKKTIVWVEVKYSGLAKDFGWVLPVPSKPKVAVGTSWVFDRFDQRHAPRFSTTVEPTSENCRSWYSYCFGDTASSSSSGGGGFSGGGPTQDSGASAPGESNDGDEAVKVLEQDKAGPYDYQIIAASDAKPLLDWLNKNNYDTPAAALPVLEAHVKKGDVFVAFKLQNGAGANEVRPVVLEMEDGDPCVPLRLTAIAATDDMAVVVTLAGAGRALPKNHMHVEPNLSRLNWFGGANNYQQVLSDAIDEAAGRAFVTEFSGDSAGHGPLVGREKMIIDPVYNATDAFGLGKALVASKLPMIQDVANTIERIAPLAKQAGMEPLNFYSQLRNCAQYSGGSYCKTFLQDRSTMPVDGHKIGEALKKDFVDPLEALDAAVQGSKKITRLVMRIGPKEMDRDPLFSFSKDLPDVSNEHKATFQRVCSKGWEPYDAVRLNVPGFGSWVFDGALPNDGGAGEVGNNAIDARFAKAPAAAAVQVLDESGAAVAVAADEIELVDTAIKGSVPGKPTLPGNVTLKGKDTRWAPPKDDEKRTFVEKRDDSECTVQHVVKAWETGGGSAAAGVLPGAGSDKKGPAGDSGGGCSATPASGGEPVWLLLVLGMALWIVRRRAA